ncbi:transmembrane 7 superfamily member 3-like isoform X1 [Apostichopus japonicus]|uniref:transmembrane 7 superfamily member 3-like isoform X1 n=2 Tax=Stichopus japonicus TaxID=307972 RepID=UPI003AB1717A
MKVSNIFLMLCNVYLMNEGMAASPNLCNSSAPFRFTVPSNQLFNCFIEDSIIYTIEVELENAVAVMTQFHSLQDEVALNDSSTRESITGRHEGLLRYTGESESIASWTVQSYVNHTVHTVMMITLFQANDPIPGACNQVFVPENEPNLHLTEAPDLALIKFAAANVGSPKGSPCYAGSKSPAMALLYDLYIYYMPTKSYSETVMFGAVEKMSTPTYIMKHGQKVSSFTALQKKEVFLALFKNRGIVHNVLVFDPAKNMTTAAYVPLIDYACDEKSQGSVVCTYTDMGPTLVYTFCGLLGVILCFLGHWTFLYEVYMFGFLPTVLASFVIFTAHTDLYPYGVYTISVTLGTLGGATLMGLWWRFGRVLPTVLWISLVLGFQLSSVLFFTPFGYMSIWQNNAAFGLAFASSILVVPIFGLIFQLWVSYLACAVIGSYMMIATLSFFFGGILHYIIQNIVHRASTENFGQAVFILPKSPVDYTLITLWFFLVVGGVATQKYLTRRESDFPTCPYRSFKERRRLLRMRSREVPETVLTSGTVNSSDNERTPLVGDL